MNPIDMDSCRTAEILASHALLVNGIDVTAMTFLQLQTTYKSLFPDISIRGRSNSEIFNSIVSLILAQFVGKKDIS